MKKKLTILGSKVGIPQKPEDAILETFENKHDKLYLVNLECLEFTSLCPRTGQPDYATIEINYVPDKLMIESKALKLYLCSFRNVGSFHEDVSNRIFDDLWNVMNPKFMRLIARFHSRGGIAIHPMVHRIQENLSDSFQENTIKQYIKEWDAQKK